MRISSIIIAIFPVPFLLMIAFLLPMAEAVSMREFNPVYETLLSILLFAVPGVYVSLLHKSTARELHKAIANGIAALSMATLLFISSQFNIPQVETVIGAAIVLLTGNILHVIFCIRKLRF